MQQFSVTIEGTLTTSPTSGATRDAHEFVKFDLVHRRDAGSGTGANSGAKPMYFSVICWGEVASRALSLTRGTDVIVEASRIYVDDYHEPPTMTIAARNLAISMRRYDARPGPARPARRADLITTANGEKYRADAYADALTSHERQPH